MCALCALLKVEGLAAAVGSLESSHKSSLGRCVARIEEHVEEACAVAEPSGGTPDKKAYPRPDKFRCSVGGGEYEAGILDLQQFVATAKAVNRRRFVRIGLVNGHHWFRWVDWLESVDAVCRERFLQPLLRNAVGGAHV